MEVRPGGHEIRNERKRKRQVGSDGEAVCWGLNDEASGDGFGHKQAASAASTQAVGGVWGGRAGAPRQGQAFGAAE